MTADTEKSRADHWDSSVSDGWTSYRLEEAQKLFEDPTSGPFSALTAEFAAHVKHLETGGTGGDVVSECDVRLVVAAEVQSLRSEIFAALASREEVHSISRAALSRCEEGQEALRGTMLEQRDAIREVQDREAAQGVALDVMDARLRATSADAAQTERQAERLADCQAQRQAERRVDREAERRQIEEMQRKMHGDFMEALEIMSAKINEIDGRCSQLEAGRELDDLHAQLQGERHDWQSEHRAAFEALALNLEERVCRRCDESEALRSSLVDDVQMLAGKVRQVTQDTKELQASVDLERGLREIYEARMEPLLGLRMASEPTHVAAADSLEMTPCFELPANNMSHKPSALAVAPSPCRILPARSISASRRASLTASVKPPASVVRRGISIDSAAASAELQLRPPAPSIGSAWPSAKEAVSSATIVQGDKSCGVQQYVPPTAPWASLLRQCPDRQRSSLTRTMPSQS